MLKEPIATAVLTFSSGAASSRDQLKAGRLSHKKTSHLRHFMWERLPAAIDHCEKHFLQKKQLSIFNSQYSIPGLHAFYDCPLETCEVTPRILVLYQPLQPGGFLPQFLGPA